MTPNNTSSYNIYIYHLNSYCDNAQTKTETEIKKVLKKTAVKHFKAKDDWLYAKLKIEVVGYHVYNRRCKSKI